MVFTELLEAHNPSNPDIKLIEYFFVRAVLDDLSDVRIEVTNWFDFRLQIPCSPLPGQLVCRVLSIALRWFTTAHLRYFGLRLLRCRRLFRRLHRFLLTRCILVRCERFHLFLMLGCAKRISFGHSLGRSGGGRCYVII